MIRKANSGDVIEFIQKLPLPVSKMEYIPFFISSEREEEKKCIAIWVPSKFMEFSSIEYINSMWATANVSHHFYEKQFLFIKHTRFKDDFQLHLNNGNKQNLCDLYLFYKWFQSELSGSRGFSSFFIDSDDKLFLWQKLILQ